VEYTDAIANVYRVTRIERTSIQAGGGGKLWDSHGMPKKDLAYRATETYVHYSLLSANYPQLGWSEEWRATLTAFIATLNKPATNRGDTKAKPRMPALNKRAGRM